MKKFNETVNKYSLRLNLLTKLIENMNSANNLHGSEYMFLPTKVKVAEEFYDLPLEKLLEELNYSAVELNTNIVAVVPNPVLDYKFERVKVSGFMKKDYLLDNDVRYIAYSYDKLINLVEEGNFLFMDKHTKYDNIVLYNDKSYKKLENHKFEPELLSKKFTDSFKPLTSELIEKLSFINFSNVSDLLVQTIDSAEKFAKTNIKTLENKAKNNQGDGHSIVTDVMKLRSIMFYVEKAKYALSQSNDLGLVKTK